MVPSVLNTTCFLCFEDDAIGHEQEEEEEEEEVEVGGPEFESFLHEQQQCNAFDGEEAFSALRVKEKSHMPDCAYWERYEMNSSSLDILQRRNAVQWLLQARAYFSFLPLTAVLSVNYLDRFLSLHCMPEGKPWMYQLLSVACLSLAAKMEETCVPLLLDLQMDNGNEYVFEPRTIQRMELMVLSVLGWRISSVTPLSFLDLFITGVQEQFRHRIYIRVEEIILTCLTEISFLRYTPSVLALAALQCALEETSLGQWEDKEEDGLKSYAMQLINSEGCLRDCHLLMKKGLLLSKKRKGLEEEGGVGCHVSSPARVLEASFSYDSEGGGCSLESSGLTIKKRRRLNNFCINEQ